MIIPEPPELTTYQRKMIPEPPEGATYQRKMIPENTLEIATYRRMMGTELTRGSFIPENDDN